MTNITTDHDKGQGTREIEMVKQRRRRRVGIFYLSLTSGPGFRQAIMLPGGHGHAYVRVAIAKCDSLSEALDEATPADDEVVMNTHYIDVE